MASKTLLETLKAVTAEVGLSQPINVMSSLDGTTIPLKALAVAACDELADEYDWQALLKSHTFTTVPGQATYAKPTDYLRSVPLTAWNRSSNRPISGNTTPAGWSFLKGANTSANVGLEQRFRIAGDVIEVYPTPTAAQTVAFDYITKNYVIDATLGTLKSDFQLDGDKTVFHPRLLINLIKLKVLQTKGLDTLSAADDYNATLEAAKGGDTPAPILSLDPLDQYSVDDYLLYDQMVRQ